MKSSRYASIRVRAKEYVDKHAYAPPDLIVALLDALNNTEQSGVLFETEIDTLKSELTLAHQHIADFMNESKALTESVDRLASHSIREGTGAAMDNGEFTRPASPARLTPVL